MITRKELIKALRCSASVPPKGHSCKGCPYRLLEEVDENIPVKADIEINGTKYWESCDCDQIASDAAYMLEKECECIERER